MTARPPTRRWPAPAADVDIVVDYLWGRPASDAMTALVRGRTDRSRALDWIQIGSMAGPTIELPSVALRAANLRIQGNGQGAVSTRGYLAELPSLIEEINSGGIAVSARTAAAGRRRKRLGGNRARGRPHRPPAIAARWEILPAKRVQVLYRVGSHCPNDLRDGLASAAHDRRSDRHAESCPSLEPGVAPGWRLGHRARRADVRVVLAAEGRTVGRRQRHDRRRPRRLVDDQGLRRRVDHRAELSHVPGRGSAPDPAVARQPRRSRSGCHRPRWPPPPSTSR